MILAIDAGNSRTKWAVFGWGGEKLDSGVWANDTLEGDTPSSWLSCHRIIISNVAGLTVSRILQEKVKEMASAVHWLRASPAAAAVINQYENPEMLGTDRWAAVVGAWHLHKTACLVVNAGTALTVDALIADAAGARGFFLGGSITPGLQLMKKSLQQETHGVKQLDGTMQPFPGNTGDAVHSGSLYALAGVVQAMAGNLEQRVGEPARIVLAGGDAELLRQALSWFNMHNQMEIVDDLVLKGLFHIERECL